MIRSYRAKEAQRRQQAERKKAEVTHSPSKCQRPGEDELNGQDYARAKSEPTVKFQFGLGGNSKEEFHGLLTRDKSSGRLQSLEISTGSPCAQQDSTKKRVSSAKNPTFTEMTGRNPFSPGSPSIKTSFPQFMPSSENLNGWTSVRNILPQNNLFQNMCPGLRI